MGFNKRYLPELEVLRERRSNYKTNEDFYYATVGKADALIGPSESIKFLDEIYKEIIEKEKNEYPHGRNSRKL